MRVSKEKAAENRERILKEASRLMRERGISGAGVDALTEAAGMTHGSLYSQFGSKERLIEEALEHVIAEKGKEMAGFPHSAGTCPITFQLNIVTAPEAAALWRPCFVKCRVKARACVSVSERIAGHDRPAERTNGARAETAAAR